MSSLVDLKVGDKIIKVSKLKKDYILNIFESIKLCDKINKVVLFGSCLTEYCTDKSDIDIAVFGDLVPSKMLRRASYKKFVDSIYDFEVKGQDWQDYDILYFNKEENSLIMYNIIHYGVVIYNRDNTEFKGFCDIKKSVSIERIKSNLDIISRNESNIITYALKAHHCELACEWLLKLQIFEAVRLDPSKWRDRRTYKHNIKDLIDLGFERKSEIKEFYVPEHIITNSDSITSWREDSISDWEFESKIDKQLVDKTIEVAKEWFNKLKESKHV